jgi:hypothetical protein
MFYRCQRFTSNQYKVKRKGSKERSKGNWSAPWSGTPDNVRCTREDRPQTLQLRVSQAQLCYNSPDCPVCHRTVRCASGATATCAQRSTLTVNSAAQWTRQKSEQLVRGTPDCPVPHEDKASNGRPTPSPNGRMTWRHTGQCPVRPSPAAFSNGYNLVGGYKYHSNRPLQEGEPKQHSKVI